MKKTLFFLFIFVLTQGFSQNGIIRGVVIDDAVGESIIGANVFVKDNPTSGAVTDLDGSFSFSLPAGTYTLQVKYIGYQTITIDDVVSDPKEENVLGTIRLSEGDLELDEVVVTAKVIKTSEVALLTLKRKSAVMMDGISSAKFKQVGDATAVEAAKRVTGVSIEGGKYVYVRGLGDRYSKSMLNNVDIPGLDPDKNTLQMDIFPTNLIDNIIISKNFAAEMPADFTGGLLNIETKDFPERKLLSVSVSTSYNPQMNLNSDYLTYNGGGTDFLGFDDGTRALPAGAQDGSAPFPFVNSNQEVSDFAKSFNPTLGARRTTSPMDFSASFSMANQIGLKNSTNSLGYIFSLSYKTDYKYYDDVVYGEFQKTLSPTEYQMNYATVQSGQLGEKNVLLGGLAGIAYKTAKSKYRLTLLHLQNGESRAGQFDIDNNGAAVGQSGYIAKSDNLEYNQRGLTNVLINGVHKYDDGNWEVDWRLSPTLSSISDPDIRKTAFTYTPTNTFFSAGAGGNPSRIWRSLTEVNGIGKVDITRKHLLFDNPGKLKFGLSNTYKFRDYEILSYDIQFFANQSWDSTDPNAVLNPENIYPNEPNAIYFQSGNGRLNPNAYQSNSNNAAAYISEEFQLLKKLNAVIGLRAEYFVQRHTGRDQLYANGDKINGRNLDNEVVLESLDLFPTANFIYGLTDMQNLRASYSRTIARPSFKELSFAQILDPITNRIFNGSLFTYSSWNGQLVSTNIDNMDLRWELFMENGQIFSVSAFAKAFNNPIELVRIPEQQTSTEYQPRNVGDGFLYGFEVEFRKDLDFITPAMKNFNISGNLTIIESMIEMTDVEFNSRQSYLKDGETLDRNRQMAGQSPYVINGGVSYNSDDLGLDVGVFYNVKGPTLTIVGAGLFPDIYMKPFHSLNFSVLKKIGKNQNTTIDFKVANILNSKLQSVYQSYNADDQIFNSINPGISFGLGLSHNF
ncbi:MAG: TonB-dependent receptor [Saprospiraceae bacterium]